MKRIINRWFFNTTNEVDEVAIDYESKAEKQDKKILSFFLQNRQSYSPSQVHKSVFGENTPITSVRRSINTLTRRGLLAKTGEKVISPYGRPENKWILNII